MNIKPAALLIVSILASTFLAAAPLAAAPIEPGASQQTASIDGKSMPIFLYRPSCSQPSLLLVFHGTNRDADHYRDHARPLADRLCMIVLAPAFDKKTFPSWRYQRGGIVNNNGVVQAADKWTGKLVLKLVDWAREQEGKPLAYSLIGHSAGGQFLERVVAYIPTEAQRIVIANPSSYVLASTDVAAPYGLGRVYRTGEAEAELKRYLAAPVTVFLGEDDLGDKNLAQTPEAKAQGKTRYERGLFAFNAAKKQAQDRGLAFNWRLVEMPGVGHNAKRMFSSPQAEQALAP